jgi:predicted nuclease with TOPRIM domain
MSVEQQNHDETPVQRTDDRTHLNVGEVRREVLRIHVEVKALEEGHKRLHEDHHRLHNDQQRLEAQLSHVEQELASSKIRLDGQTERNELIHGQLVGWLKDIKTSVDHWVQRFEVHDDQEKADRKSVISSQRAIIITLVLFFLSTLGGISLLAWDIYKTRLPDTTTIGPSHEHTP